MTTFQVNFSFAVLCLTAIIATSTAEQVKVSVYYEVLCPDSINFVINQLSPASKSIGNIMNIDLVPYGKASTKKNADGTYEFNCQHGPNECKGNKVHACALAKFPKESTLAWVKCTMSKNSPHEAGSACAQELGLNFEPVDACSTSQEGDDLLAAMGVRTKILNPKATFVPWINLNDVHNDAAFNDLKGEVCKAYTGANKPAACP